VLFGNEVITGDVMPLSSDEWDKLKLQPSKKLLKERLKIISENKEKFEYYIDSFYKKEKIFSKSSFNYHKRVINYIRKHQHEEFFTNESFQIKVYATLDKWGLNKKGRKLVDFNIFRNSIKENLTLLHELSGYKLNLINDQNKDRINNNLASLYENLKVMKTKVKLVGFSKALHHLVPDLVPPMDRKYTLRFFYNTKSINEGEGEKKFLEVFGAFSEICMKLDLTERDLKRGGDTSIPKLIDNAIVGFVSELPFKN
jgi:hypothetical protein